MPFALDWYSPFATYFRDYLQIIVLFLPFTTLILFADCDGIFVS